MSLRDIDWRQHPRSGGYTAIIEEAEKRHELPSGLLGALIHRESRFKEDAVSDAGAVGIAQLMPIHHSAVDPRNPKEAIDYAAGYLAQLNERFDSWDEALAAYNYGPTNVARLRRRHGDSWQAVLPAETRDYLASLSPERVAYPATPSNQEDPLLALAKNVDVQNSGIEQEANEVLAMMASEPEVEENLRTRGWLVDSLAGAARGPLKAFRSYFSGAIDIGDALDERVGRLQINSPFGDKPFIERVSPEAVAAKNATSVPGVLKAFDVPLTALGQPQTAAGGLTEAATQFLTGFLPVNRLMKGVDVLGKSALGVNVLRSTAAGAVASAVAFEGHEANLADMIQSFPALENPVADFLAGQDEDNELELRLKSAFVDAGFGTVVDGLIFGVRYIKAGRKQKVAADADALDTRPELDIDAVSSRSIARHDPLPPKAEAAAPEPTAQVAPEVSLEGTSAKLSDTIDEETGEIIVRSGNGEGIATITDNSIRMERVDVAEAARGKGEGLAILRRFAQRAHERGLPLFSDVSISPAQARVWEKLKAEGYDVHRNEASINPETGNLVSADPRKSVFEAAPRAGDAAQAEARKVLETPGERDALQQISDENRARLLRGESDVPEVRSDPVAPDAHTPEPAPVATAVADAPKPDYGTSPIDVTEARLREEIGLTDELVAEVRGKLASGKIQPEEVADLIGINGARIDWTGVADEKALAGMLNTVSRVIDDVVGGAARYKRVSVQTVEKLAGKIGATADDAHDLFQALKEKGGVEARVMAARTTLNASAAKLFRLGQRVHTGQASPEELLELAIHDRRHMLLQAVVRGSKSMIARSLRMMQESVRVEESAFNLSKARAERQVRKATEGLEKAKRARTAKPKSTESGKPAVEDTAVEFAQGMLDHAKAAGRTLSPDDVRTALSEIGYTERQVRRLAKTIAKATDATQVHAIARTTGFGKAMQGRLATLYINNILSGFPTFAINITSGWLKIAESIVERYGAAVIGIARGGDKYDLIAAHRAAIATKAMWGDAFKLAAAAWKEGLPQVDLFARAEVAIRGGVGRSVGENIITAPSRVILTTDEYFKRVFYQQELHARAVEIAAGKARLFKGKAADQVFEQEFREVLSNPTDDVRLDAIENARYNTFQNPLESELGNGLVRLTNATPALKFIVPFIRTPANIAKQGILERTPLALLRAKTWKSIAEGGRAGNTVAFRTALSTIAFGVIFDAALDGQITGSRASRGANKNSKDFDQQVPYTFYGIQYNRLDPWGTSIGLIADLATLYKEYRLRSDNETEVDDPELTEAFGNILGILSTNVLDKTYFKGISDFVQAISEAKSRPDILKNYVQQQGASLVPFSSMQRNFARTHDEFAREAFTFSDKLMAQTPFLRESLPVKRDYLGRPIREAERLGPDWLSPILISKDDPDPAAKAFAELEMPYQMPDKVIGGVQLTGEQYSKLVEVRGQFIRDRIMGQINSGSWARTPLFIRQDMVRAFAEAGGQKARNELMRESRDDPKGLFSTVREREAALNALKRAAE